MRTKFFFYKIKNQKCFGIFSSFDNEILIVIYFWNFELGFKK